MNNNNTGPSLLPIVKMKTFPEIINDQLEIVNFFAAAEDLVSLVDRLGAAFTPVKLDMDGNIAKIKKYYNSKPEPCLFKLMTAEGQSGKNHATEGVLWLNRAFLFFEISFQQILELLRHKKYDGNMTKIFTLAYEGSVKKYHNWVSQRLFHLICKISPNVETMLNSLGMSDDKELFISELATYTQTLSVVRNQIDEYFRVNKLFIDKQ